MGAGDGMRLKGLHLQPLKLVEITLACVKRRLIDVHANHIRASKQSCTDCEPALRVMPCCLCSMALLSPSGTLRVEGLDQERPTQHQGLSPCHSPDP